MTEVIEEGQRRGGMMNACGDPEWYRQEAVRLSGKLVMVLRENAALRSRQCWLEQRVSELELEYAPLRHRT